MELTIIDNLLRRHLVPVEHMAFNRAGDDKIGPVEAAYIQVETAADAGWFGEGVTGAIVEDMAPQTALRLSEQIVKRYRECIELDPN